MEGGVSCKGARTGGTARAARPAAAHRPCTWPCQRAALARTGGSVNAGLAGASMARTVRLGGWACEDGSGAPDLYSFFVCVYAPTPTLVPPAVAATDGAGGTSWAKREVSPHAPIPLVAGGSLHTQSEAPRPPYRVVDIQLGGK